MGKLFFIVLLSVLASIANAEEKTEQPFIKELPNTNQEELQKMDCHFGPGTWASKLEKIKYDLIVNGQNFSNDPNLLP